MSKLLEEHLEEIGALMPSKNDSFDPEAEPAPKKRGKGAREEKKRRGGEGGRRGRRDEEQENG
jgi:hypothetical protein